MCVEIHTEGPPFSCRNMYLWYILLLLHSSVKDIIHFKWRLIEDVVGFFISPTAGEGILTHLVCVSLVSFSEEAVSETCCFKIGQYCPALLNSQLKEAYE